MKTVYHIDRLKSLESDKEIQLFTDYDLDNIEQNIITKLFPSGLSKHGISYCSDITLTPPNHLCVSSLPGYSSPVNNHILEFNLEMYRRAFYPNLHSRMQSLFALPNLSDLSNWEELLQDSNIFEIKCNELFIFDAFYLRGGFTISPKNDGFTTFGFSPSCNLEQLEKYWSGSISEHPKLEVLIPLPIKIGKKVKR